MAKTRWYQERQREGYYRQAKKEGYRARSAYKLQQVNAKYNLLGRGDAVADLGCAPGGWSQVLVEIVGQEGFVVGVDLQRMRPIPGAHFVAGDFTQSAVRSLLGVHLAASGRKHLDGVVSDMAPDMSGQYDVDQARSVHLCELALAFAVDHLRPGGHFVTKVFEGKDFQAFREEVRRHFRSVYQFHPPASRSSSSEIYLIGKNFMGAGKDEDGPAADAEAEGAAAGTLRAAAATTPRPRPSARATKPDPAGK